MGDLLMTTPAIRAAQQSGGIRRHITCLTSPAAAEAAQLVPEIDSVITYEAPWVKSTPDSARPENLLAMASELRSQRFDAAVVFTVCTQNPLPAVMLAYLAGIPLRLAHCHENPYQLLTDWAPDFEPQRGFRHEVERQLALVASVGFETEHQRLSLAVDAETRAATEYRLRTLGVRTGSFVVVHPGATAASRRYPPEMCADVIRGLAVLGYDIVLTGADCEETLVEDIRERAGVPCISLAGALSVAELAAVIGSSRLLVANNSGPVHIAAAMGTPVIDIYALTNPQHTPWQVPNRVLSHDVPCRNCLKSVCPEGHQNCLRLVTPQSVVQASAELLAEVGVRKEAVRGAGPGTVTIVR
jgi:lipopolysaccharide heptosyltransferase II